MQDLTVLVASTDVALAVRASHYGIGVPGIVSAFGYFTLHVGNYKSWILIVRRYIDWHDNLAPSTTFVATHCLPRASRMPQYPLDRLRRM